MIRVKSNCRRGFGRISERRKIHLFIKSNQCAAKIANYHFTTLTPNLGVVDLEGTDGFVIADIPGLIEGASEGVGLGHQFLRHIELVPRDDRYCKTLRPPKEEIRLMTFIRSILN